MSNYPLLRKVKSSSDVDFLWALPGDAVPYLQSRVDLDYPVRPGVRVYQYSSNSMALQLFTNGPTSSSKKAVPRSVFSIFISGKENMLAEEIRKMAETLE